MINRIFNPRIFVLAIIVFGIGSVAHAEDLVWATGRVVSARDKRPLSGAIVAVYDDKGRVVDYARTDPDGNYALTVPRAALHLDKYSPDFLHQVTGGVTRLVGGVAGGLKYGVKAAKPGLNDAISRARVYWMETEIHLDGKKETRGMAAWFDTASLTHAGNQDPSKIETDFLTFTDARLEPSIAEPGQTVTLTVDLPAPPEPETPVVVVAKNIRTGKLFGLTPAGNGKYRAEIRVDKKSPKFDEPITVIAYAEQTEKPGRSKRVEDALNHGGFWDTTKPFVYNPLFVVSRNRAEVVLTVVEATRKKR